MVKEKEKKENGLNEEELEKENEKIDEQIILQIKKGVAEYSSNTLSMEKEREKRIYETANAIVTFISILLVAIMGLIFELLDRLKQVDYLIVIFGSILAVTLLSSLFFAVS